MKKWLQRTVGTASLACGIALAAAGIAHADQPAELSNPLGAVDSLTSVADTGAVTDLAGGLPTDSPVGMVPDATQLTGQVDGVTGALPGGKVVSKAGKVAKSGERTLNSATEARTEGLPVADGLPVVGGLTQGGIPVVGGGGNPVTGGGAGSDMIDGIPLVGNMTGSAVRGMTPGAGKTENVVGMGADLVGSKVLGSGAVGGLRDDVTRPAEDLPLVGQLPVVGQLGNAVPMGSTPLGVDKLGPK